MDVLEVTMRETHFGLALLHTSHNHPVTHHEGLVDSQLPNVMVHVAGTARLLNLPGIVVTNFYCLLGHVSPKVFCTQHCCPWKLSSLDEMTLGSLFGAAEASQID
jgi:hypothetical protein